MTIFISYARANQAAAEQLRDDVERCHREVWVDRELTGGQSWWRAILQHIRDCDVFVVALSAEWVNSRACDLELRYALALNRPVLPVMVSRIDPRLAPPAIADAQIISYLQRSPEATFALRDALDTLPAAPPLPTPLPPEPAAPISYLHNIITMLNAPALAAPHQHELWRQLQATLVEADGDERDDLLKLVHRLRRRPDLIPQLRPQLDAVLGPETHPGERTLPPTGSQIWTQPTRILPVPAPVQPPPARSRRVLLWVAVLTAAVLLVPAIWITVANARGGTGSTPSPTTTTTTESTTPPPGPTTTRPPTTANPPKTFTMPDLHGKNSEQAKSKLKASGWVGTFDIQTAAVPDRSQHGLVIRQTPSSGQKVATNVGVTVTVGQFNPSSPPPTTSTTQPVIR